MSAIKKLCIGLLVLSFVCVSAFAAQRYNTRDAETDDFIVKESLGASVIYRTVQSVALYVPGTTLGDKLIAPGERIEAGDPVASYYAYMTDVDIERTEVALAQEQDDFDFEKERRMQVIAEYRSAAESASDPDEARMNELMADREELLLGKYAAEGQANIDALTAVRDSALASSEPKYVSAGISGSVAYVTRADEGSDIYGRELAMIFDPESLIIRVDNSSGTLKYGMHVDLVLEGDGRTNVSGTVISADNVLPGTLHGGAAYILPDQPVGEKGYNRATVSAQAVAVNDVIVISNQTLQFASGRPFVRVLDADGVVHTRYVDLGIMGANESWIISGVEPGDKLIVK